MPNLILPPETTFETAFPLPLPDAQPESIAGAPEPPPSGRQLRRLAVAPGDREPDFETVFASTMAACRLNMTVCVICLSPCLLQAWWERFDRLPQRLVLVDLTNNGRTTFSGCRNILSYRDFDMVVFHGAWRELNLDDLAVNYVARLIDSVPKGLIVLA